MIDSSGKARRTVSMSESDDRNHVDTSDEGDRDLETEFFDRGKSPTAKVLQGCPE